jgi:RNA polymerase sigma factor (sigma-70 family)
MDTTRRRLVQFRETSWSRIRLAKQKDTRSLEMFARDYRDPIYNYIRRAGVRETDAEDLTQEVFVRVFADRVLERADRSRGRFRSLLLSVTKHVMHGELRRRRAKKRGGSAESVSIEQADSDDEPGGQETDPGFDRLRTDPIA